MGASATERERERKEKGRENRRCREGQTCRVLSEHNFDGDGPSITDMIYYDIVFFLNFDMGSSTAMPNLPETDLRVPQVPHWRHPATNCGKCRRARNSRYSGGQRQNGYLVAEIGQWEEFGSERLLLKGVLRSELSC